jgi:hypothetical protein
VKWTTALLTTTLLLIAIGCFFSFRRPAAYAPQDPITVKSIDPLIKISSSYDPNKIDETNTYDIARGERFYVQLVISNKDEISQLSIDEATPVQGINLLSKEVVQYVNISTESKSINGRVASTNGEYPDPLFPMSPSTSIKAGKSTAVWLSYLSDKNIRAGSYVIALKIKGSFINKKVFDVSKSITINVFPCTLNNAYRPYFSNWLFVENPTLGQEVQKLKFFHGQKAVVPYSRPFWADIKMVAKFMVDAGQNSVLISPQRLARFSYDSKNQLNIDFSRFDTMVQCFLAAGFKGRIEGWHITSRSGDWDSDFILHYIGKNKNGNADFLNGNYKNEDVQKFYRVYLPLLIKHLKEKGWDKMYYQHVGDEPTDKNAQSYLDIVGLIKTIAPELKIIDAIQTTKVGSVIDVPVPQLDFLKRDYPFYQSLVSQGKEVWFYTAFLPQGTYANRFIEQQGISHQLLFWIASRYNLKGVLNWGFNSWETDVFSNLGRKSGPFFLPAGDGWLVYPQNGKLIPSIRLRLMQDGIEDYMLLEALKKKNPAVADKILKQVIFDFDRYETDVQKFRAIRKKILQSL